MLPRERQGRLLLVPLLALVAVSSATFASSASNPDDICFALSGNGTIHASTTCVLGSLGRGTAGDCARVETVDPYLIYYGACP